MTGLTEDLLYQEPIFRIGLCISNYLGLTGRNPDYALIDERSNKYLEGLLEKRTEGVFLKSNGGVEIKVYRIENLPQRKKEKLKLIEEIPFYLCRAGIRRRIKYKSIVPYDLKDLNFKLEQMQ